MKKVGMILCALGVLLISGCSSDAEVVSENLSTDADQFKILRRIVFTNLMTGEYLFMVEGNCSINADMADEQLEVTCKLGEDKYQKHYFGLSEMSTYTVEQLEWVEADKYKYKIVFKPESIIPIEFDVE